MQDRPPVRPWEIGLGVVVLVSGGTDPLVLFRWWGQLAMLVVAVLAGGVVLVRRRAFDVVQGLR